MLNKHSLQRIVRIVAWATLAVAAAAAGPADAALYNYKITYSTSQTSGSGTVGFDSLSGTNTKIGVTADLSGWGLGSNFTQADLLDPLASTSWTVDPTNFSLTLLRISFSKLISGVNYSIAFSVNSSVAVYCGGSNGTLSIGGTGSPNPTSASCKTPTSSTSISPAFANASIAYNPVPVPAALPLLASGIAGLGWLRRRRPRAA